MPTLEVMAICNAIQNIRPQLQKEQITETLNLQVEKAPDPIIQQGATASRLRALDLADLQVHPQQIDLLHPPDHLSQVIRLRQGHQEQDNFKKYML
jgi:hypothetical protein